MFVPEDTASVIPLILHDTREGNVLWGRGPESTIYAPMFAFHPPARERSMRSLPHSSVGYFDLVRCFAVYQNVIRTKASRPYRWSCGQGLLLSWMNFSVVKAYLNMQRPSIQVHTGFDVCSQLASSGRCRGQCSQAICIHLVNLVTSRQ